HLADAFQRHFGGIPIYDYNRDGGVVRRAPPASGGECGGKRNRRQEPEPPPPGGNSGTALARPPGPAVSHGNLIKRRAPRFHREICRNSTFCLKSLLRLHDGPPQLA